MKQVKIKTASKLELKNIKGFFNRKVTKFGNGAKVNCPKEYLGQPVYLVIVNEPGSE